MNRKPLILLAALALLGSSASFAQEATSDAWLADASSTLTRAEVRADVAQARADGSIRFGERGYLEPARSVRTRAEVVAATLAARASGELAAIDAEAAGTASPAAAVRFARTGR